MLRRVSVCERNMSLVAETTVLYLLLPGTGASLRHACVVQPIALRSRGWARGASARRGAAMSGGARRLPLAKSVSRCDAERA